VRKFTRHSGVAAPLLRSNIDTDAIIPSVEMKTVSRKGLADGLFAGWRYLDREARIPNPEFILNRPGFERASILLAGENFGCGSSREHAVWALDEFGIRALIAPSYGSIFRANCIANGLLPITLPFNEVQALAAAIGTKASAHELAIDLELGSILTPDGSTCHFEIREADAAMLLNGWDPIALTLQHEDAIRAFTSRDRDERPWAYLAPPE
jgi:3-isopropylmalate/(R)-2-methylmalate dehydratase small subunit